MKTRIKIDSSILSFVIILTGFLYAFPYLYTLQPLESFMDFFGIISILQGTFLRMAARGYKKSGSAQGHDLVMNGPYTLVRNPMYLGSFFMGVGFVLLVWPWWGLPIFAVLFYLRFVLQVKAEEAHLRETFGAVYEEYCWRVPRIFPSIRSLRQLNVHEAFPLSGAFSTKEKWGLVAWPIVAIILENFQERLVFGTADVGRIITGFLFTAFIFVVGVAAVYLVSGEPNAQDPKQI